MRPIQIEAWALEIIDRMKSGRPLEDFRVELKSEWPDPQKAARQLAGHANSARGEPILWLVGVAENEGITGATHNELANWLTSLQAEFDGVAPSVIDVNIPANGETVVALCFETDRAPYVVRNPSFGIERGVSISHEVPWREGTRTRSASRADLIRLLAPSMKLPEIDVLGGELVASASAERHWVWTLRLEAYITPQIGLPCVLPFHQCEASFEIEDRIQKTNFDNIRLLPPYRFAFPSSAGPFAEEPDSLTIGHTQHEAVVQGPGRLNISAEKRTEAKEVGLSASTAKISIAIRPSGCDRVVQINKTLLWHPPDKGGIGKWGV